MGFRISTPDSIRLGMSVNTFPQEWCKNFASVYCFVTLLPMVLLSGLATPVSSMPEALQIATYANPLRFALVCVRSVYLEGGTLADIAPNFVPMLAVAAVTLPLAGWLFRNRLS